LDIAGVAFTDSDFAKMQRDTAYGIRLLTAFFITWAAIYL